MEHLADLDAAGEERVARVVDEIELGWPGVADFVPNWIEQHEPGGVNWTPRKPLSIEKSASSLHPRRP